VQQLTTTLDDLENPLSTVIAMYNLEHQRSTDLDVLDSNHAIMRQHENFIEYTADSYRPPALGGFSDDIQTSEQNLDEVDQLEQFLLSAAMEDVDQGSQSAHSTHSVRANMYYNSVDTSLQVGGEYRRINS